jgi:hypothetical protein
VKRMMTDWVLELRSDDDTVNDGWNRFNVKNVNESSMVEGNKKQVQRLCIIRYV